MTSTYWLYHFSLSIILLTYHFYILDDMTHICYYTDFPNVEIEARRG